MKPTSVISTRHSGSSLNVAFGDIAETSKMDELSDDYCNEQQSANPTLRRSGNNNEVDMLFGGAQNPPHRQSHLSQRSSHGNAMRRSTSHALLNTIDQVAFADRESKAVSYLRMVVLAVLVTSAVCTAIAVYFYTRNTELRAFRDSFQDDSHRVVESVGASLYLWMGAMDTYIVSAVSIARATNQTWPFVTLPDAPVRMAKLRSHTRAVSVHQAHIVVNASQREKWEEYASTNDQWTMDALEVQKMDKNHTAEILDSVVTSRSIVGLGGNVTGDGPFLPTWQASPLNPRMAYNVDSLSASFIKETMPEISRGSSVAITRVTNNVYGANSKEATIITDVLRQRIPKDRDPTEPSSLFMFPMMDDTADHVSFQEADPSSQTVNTRLFVGVFTLQFFWRELFLDVLPDGSNGIMCVIENSCGDKFTYEINGPSVRHVGFGDYSDEAYRHLGHVVSFNDLATKSALGERYIGLPLGGETCPYTLSVYPTAKRESHFITKNPTTFTIVAILIFVFTSAVFLIYDICVERRQRKVLFTAVQSSANVALLEKMVKERTSKLEEANMRLEEANLRVTRASAAQLEHFACMSHEIRTPLNCITGLSSLMLDTEMEPMQEESMRMIVSSGDLLLTVVNDVLDYSKLESGNVEISIVRSNLQDTLNSVVQSIEAKAQPKKLTLKTLYDPLISEFVHMDCRRLQQILYNLLGNAIKFSCEGGNVELSVTLLLGSRASVNVPPISLDEVYRSDTMVVDELKHEEEDVRLRGSLGRSIFVCTSLLGKNVPDAEKKMIRFVVKDFGKGIERKDFATIFQPFRQASAETERVYGGTGLGLAITTKLVTIMGGNISVDSQEGEWSEFTVDLPIEDSPIDLGNLTKRLQNTKLILVDDDEATVQTMSQVLQRCLLDFACYKSTAEFSSSLESPGFLNSSQAVICIIHERLYQKETYQRLKNSSSILLFSHGPRYAVKESRGHYRRLTNVLPSVLLESLANARERMLAEAPPTFFRRSAVSNRCGDGETQPLRILIAEDNKINQKVLLRILKRLNYDSIDVVDDGKQACDKVLEVQYDVILMDIQMPVMTGIEACREITSRTTDHPHPSIVFVTAHVSDAFEAECRAAGGAGFLPKPFNMSDIEGCLRKYTTRK